MIDVMLACTAKQPAEQAVWLHNSGMLKQAQGDYSGVMEHYEKSLAIFEKLDCQSGIAKSFHHMGMIRQNQD